MPENQEVLRERLQQLLTQKKSRKYYAHKLGITELQVREIMDRMRRGDEAIQDVTSLSNYSSELEEVIVKMEENLQEGTGELTANVKDEIKTLEELIKKCQIDTTKWNIDRYVQNFWGSSSQPHWQVKAFLSKKTPTENFQKNFMDFLVGYSPDREWTTNKNRGLNDRRPEKKACLIINKQDEHLNKFDIDGKNDINLRFAQAYERIHDILQEADAHHTIRKVVYILGSDQFNSEWSGATVRGTPQTNIMPYQEGFSRICEYEVSMLDLLGSYADNVKVIYVPGNHDEYVGWHLIHWLKALYRNNGKYEFDLSTKSTKYMKYGNSAIMFNHGDAIKPPKLASTFPIGFKEEWSECDNFYIFTGDKHHEVSIDFNGIKFYQLPALSTAKSSWDDKMGHLCSKAELTAFLIDEERGMTNIYKQQL